MLSRVIVLFNAGPGAHRGGVSTAASSHLSCPLNLSLAKLLLSHGQNQALHLCILRPVVPGALFNVLF